MASAAPPLLPTSVPPAAPANVLPAAAPDAPTSISSPDPAATRAFLGRLYDSAKRSLSGARPWPELLDRAALSRPDSLSDATARLRKNLAYFRVNYAALVALSLAVSLLAHPFSLAALLALLAAWCFLYLLRPAQRLRPHLLRQGDARGPHRRLRLHRLPHLRRRDHLLRAGARRRRRLRAWGLPRARGPVPRRGARQWHRRKRRHPQPALLHQRRCRRRTRLSLPPLLRSLLCLCHSEEVKSVAG